MLQRSTSFVLIFNSLYELLQETESDLTWFHRASGGIALKTTFLRQGKFSFSRRSLSSFFAFQVDFGGTVPRLPKSEFLRNDMHSLTPQRQTMFQSVPGKGSTTKIKSSLLFFSSLSSHHLTFYWIMSTIKTNKVPYDIFPILFQTIAEFTNESRNLIECSSGTSTLAIAAQVSRDWRHLSLLHLYQHVTVNLASTQKLLIVLKKNPQLALRVESLSVIDPLLNIDGRWEYFPTIERLVSLCTNLKSLETVDVKTSKFVRSETLEALHLKLHQQVYYFQIRIPSSVKLLSIHDREQHLQHTTEIDEAFERLQVSVTTRFFPEFTSPGNLAITTLILATNSYNAIKLVPSVSETLKNLDIYLSNNLNPDVLLMSLLPTFNKLERLRVQFTPTRNQVHISTNNIQTNTTTFYHHVCDLLC